MENVIEILLLIVALWAVISLMGLSIRVHKDFDELAEEEKKIDKEIFNDW